MLLDASHSLASKVLVGFRPEIRKYQTLNKVQRCSNVEHKRQTLGHWLRNANDAAKS